MVECGRLEDLAVRTVRAIAAVLKLDLVFAVRNDGAAIDRLLDRAHSDLVDFVARRLESEGWIVVVEFSFNHYGDRGSVDILAWHPGRAALLIIEVKSELTDIQALFRAIDMKARVVPPLAARDRAWRAQPVDLVIVVADTSRQRKTVADRAAIFAAGFPARTVEVRRWIGDPSRANLRGLWFVRPASTTGTIHKPSPPKRVRRPKQPGMATNSSVIDARRPRPNQASPDRGARISG